MSGNPRPRSTGIRRGLDVEGNEVFPVGSEVKGVPGNPDYVLRKARLGMYPYPPSDGCSCSWCSQRSQNTRALEAMKEENEYMCPEDGCAFAANGKTHNHKLSSLRMHKMKKHEASK